MTTKQAVYLNSRSGLTIECPGHGARRTGWLFDKMPDGCIKYRLPVENPPQRFDELIEEIHASPTRMRVVLA